MSVANIDSNSDYEISVEASFIGPIEVYTCTVSYINPLTNEITSATATSYISGRFACKEAYDKLVAILEP
jgi:hypothetical protein